MTNINLVVQGEGLKEPGSMPPAKLIEGQDYVVEEGLFIFTAEYLLERGHCCQSGCRHCPYGFAKSDQKPPSTPEVVQTT